MRYRTSFQCPDTGQTIIANYAFGRLTVRAVTDDGEEVMSDTLAWCKRHNNKRFSTFDAANEYLIKVTDGEAYGFDEN